MYACEEGDALSKSGNKERDTRYALPVEILEVKMLNDVNHISTNEPLDFWIKLKHNTSTPKSFKVGIFINNQYDEHIGTAYSNQISTDSSKETWELKVSIPNHNLAKGRYVCQMNLSNFNYDSFGQDLDLVHNVIMFEVDSIGLNPKADFFAWHKNMGGCAFQGTKAEII